jgi:hypothetical protein
MVSMSDELKERNILKLILIMRFTCATLDVGHPISGPDARVCDLAREKRFVDFVIVMMPIVRTPSPQYPLDLMKWQQNIGITIVILEA